MPMINASMMRARSRFPREASGGMPASGSAAPLMSPYGLRAYGPLSYGPDPSPPRTGHCQPPGGGGLP